MNCTRTETRNAHWQAVVRLLRECDTHLEALELPTFFDQAAFLKETGQMPFPYRHAGSREKDKKDDTPSSRPHTTEIDGIDCIIIPCSDFEQLFHDMVSMHDMLNYLIGIQERKAVLSKSMMEIAGKLDTSASECKSINDIINRMDAIADRWADMDITPVDQP